MPSAKWLDTRLTEKRKAVAFLYINDKGTEKEIREVILFTIAQI